MTDAECVAFLQWALPRLRMRWRGFRRVRKQVCRRIRRRMKELGLAEAGEYRSFLESHEDEWATLDACCRITISRFFRDREVFQLLQGVALPALVDRARKRGANAVRCWSAGCGSGEEAYTLSLLWRLAPKGGPMIPPSERFPRIRMRVTGTDTDPKVLERARKAMYPRGTLKDLPPSWIAHAFDQVAGGFSLRESFREGVVFLRQDIRKVLPNEAFDLILCRNLVFTYFEEELQKEILFPLLRRLRDGGTLVIGGHEELPEGPWPLIRLKDGIPVYRKEGRGSWTGSTREGSS